MVTQTGVLQPKAWAPRRVAGLVIVSLVLMAGSFVVLAHFSGAPPLHLLPPLTRIPYANPPSSPLPLPPPPPPPTPPEIDVATTALPAEVMRRVTAADCKAVPTGIEHGTVTVIIERQPVEVTTLRQDVETFGRKAGVAFGRDWRADAERRDFTINALSASADGMVYDYVGGLADIAVRRVRFIGDAQKRIEEGSV